MTSWTVHGITYRVLWLHPNDADWNKERRPTHHVVNPTLTLVVVTDDSVPRGERLYEPKQGEAHVIAAKAQTAVGNVLTHRNRIEFLRLAKTFPYGMDNDPVDPDARAQGAPRKRLLQPGEFPSREDTRRSDDDGPGFGTVVTGMLIADALANSGRTAPITTPSTPHQSEAASGRERGDNGGFTPTDSHQSTETAPPIEPTRAPTPEPEVAFTPDRGNEYSSNAGGGFSSDVGGPSGSD